MGNWRYNVFENDGAADFIVDVEEEGLTKIYEVILNITSLPESEYLKAPECEQALVAIEYIAAAKGNPHPDFPESSVSWMKEKNVADILESRSDDLHTPNFDLTEMSLNAIERIQSNSELQELWEKSEHAAAWVKELEDLKKRVN